MVSRHLENSTKTEEKISAKIRRKSSEKWKKVPLSHFRPAQIVQKIELGTPFPFSTPGYSRILICSYVHMLSDKIIAIT